MIIEPCLTVAEVALLLKSSKSHIYDLIARGDLEAIRITERRTRIRKSSLEEFSNCQIDNEKVGAYNKDVQPPRMGA